MKKTKGRNGKRYTEETRLRARELRAQGRTHREIQKELGISRGSAHLWTQGIELSKTLKSAIYKRRRGHQWTVKERKLAGKRLKPFRRKKYKPAELLEKIKRFHRENGRIPLKREFNSLRVFRYNFGSWNNAIRAAGFQANPVLFSKKFIAVDGHCCDSFSERIVDDWLHAKRIVHQRNWHYGSTKMTADFFVEPDIIIEFFGLAGVQDEYDITTERKRIFFAEHDIHLVEVYPGDIFPQRNLSEIGKKLDILLR